MVQFSQGIITAVPGTYFTHWLTILVLDLFAAITFRTGVVPRSAGGRAERALLVALIIFEGQA